MASTYENDLRLEEMATGENSGSWGTKTNTNLELVADAFSYGTEIIADADTAITIADGAADAARSLALKINSSEDLTTTRVVTLGPNTTSKVWIIENNTSGGQDLTISAGSGSNVTLPNGVTKIIATDGIGAAANVTELYTNLHNITIDGILSLADGTNSAPSLTNTGDTNTGLYFPAADEVGLTVGGTQRLNVSATGVDVTGALEVTTTALVTGVLTTTAATVSNGGGQFNGAINVGVDDTGYDVKFFGDTASAYMLWDASEDDLILGGAAGLSVNSTALVTGVLTTTAATVFNGGFAANDGSTISTADNTTQLTLISTDADATGGPILDFYRNSASPADGDDTGQIRMQGENGAGETISYVSMGSQIADMTDGTEDGKFYINTVSGGSNVSRMYLTDTETIFNDSSVNLDFRVESDGYTHALFVDAGNNNLILGGTAIDQSGTFGYNLASDDIRHVRPAATTGDTLIAAVNGISNGLQISDDTSNNRVYRFHNVGAQSFVLGMTEAAFNETSNDRDFRVESDSNSHMLFVDAGNDQVVVGGSLDLDAKLSVIGSKSTTAGIPNTQLTVYDNSAMASNTGGAITLWGNYTTGGDGAEGASIEAVKANGTSGNYQYGIWLKSRTHGGSMDSRLYMDQSQTIFNEGGATTDFRVESNSNANMLFVDAVNDRVGIATGSPSYRFDQIGTLALRNGSIMLGRDAGTTTGGIHFYNPNGHTNQLRIYEDPGLWGGTSGANNTQIQIYGGAAYNLLLDGASGVSFDAGSNYLGVYEQGTWTATYIGSATAGSSPTATQATYTRVGNIVVATCSFKNATASGAVGNMYITGLPYAASNGSNGEHFASAAQTGLGTDVLGGSVINGESRIRMRDVVTTVYEPVVNTSGFYLFITMTYTAA